MTVCSPACLVAQAVRRISSPSPALRRHYLLKLALCGAAVLFLRWGGAAGAPHEVAVELGHELGVEAVDEDATAGSGCWVGGQQWGCLWGRAELLCSMLLDEIMLRRGMEL